MRPGSPSIAELSLGPDMRTSDPDIFALGECAEAHGQCFGLVAPLYDMANIVAAQLAGDADAAFNPSATATKLKVTGINLFSAGDFADGEDREEIVLRDAARGVYKRLVLKDDQLVGAVLYGDVVARRVAISTCCSDGADIADIRETMMFGPGGHGGAPLDPSGGRCSACRTMRKSAAATACARARSSRRSRPRAVNQSRRGARPHQGLGVAAAPARGLVEQVLKLTLGDAYAPAAGPSRSAAAPTSATTTCAA